MPALLFCAFLLCYSPSNTPLVASMQPAGDYVGRTDGQQPNHLLSSSDSSRLALKQQLWEYFSRNPSQSSARRSELCKRRV